MKRRHIFKPVFSMHGKREVLMNRFEKLQKTTPPWEKTGSWLSTTAVAAVIIVMSVFVNISMGMTDSGPAVQPFQPPVAFDSSEIDAAGVAMRYFDFVGEVFMVAGDGSRIVVYDASFTLAPGVSTSGIRQGMYVGLKFNENRQVAAIEHLRHPELMKGR